MKKELLLITSTILVIVSSLAVHGLLRRQTTGGRAQMQKYEERVGVNGGKIITVEGFVRNPLNSFGLEGAEMEAIGLKPNPEGADDWELCCAPKNPVTDGQGYFFSQCDCDWDLVKKLRVFETKNPEDYVDDAEYQPRCCDPVVSQDCQNPAHITDCTPWGHPNKVSFNNLYLNDLTKIVAGPVVFYDLPAPTPTLTPSLTPTPTPVLTITPSPTPTLTPTPTPTLIPSPRPTLSAQCSRCDTNSDRIIEEMDIREGVGTCFGSSPGKQNWFYCFMYDWNLDNIINIFDLVYCSQCSYRVFPTMTPTPTQTPIPRPTLTSTPTLVPIPTIYHCNDLVRFGGQGIDEREWEMGMTSGEFTLYYNMMTIPDIIEIFYEGRVIYSSGGYVSGKTTVLVRFAGSSTRLRIRITGDQWGTLWEYKVNCPES